MWALQEEGICLSLTFYTCLFVLYAQHSKHCPGKQLALWSVQCDPFPRVRTSGSRLWHAAGVGGICVPLKSPFLFFLSFGKKISFGHILVSFGERYEANNRESFFVYFVYFKHIKPPLTSVTFFLFSLSVQALLFGQGNLPSSEKHCRKTFSFADQGDTSSFHLYVNIYCLIGRIQFLVLIVLSDFSDCAFLFQHLCAEQKFFFLTEGNYLLTLICSIETRTCLQ